MSGTIGIPVIGASDELPEQDWTKILLHHERFYRASEAHWRWAEGAKKCVNYLEGKQWSEADLRKLAEEGRPALTLNKVRPLVALAIGYHLNNQTDRRALPGNDGTGTADMARVISHVMKNISQENELQYVDAEVFLDAISGGRGFWDTRMDFDRNMLGEVAMTAKDPFSTYLDPDATSYDLNKHAFVISSDWLSMDEITAFYGQQASDRLRPMAYNGVSSAPNLMPYGAFDEISPARTFAQIEDWPDRWRAFIDQSANWVDTYRKTIRRIDIQYKIRTKAWFFVDLETGDLKRVPDNWSMDKMQKVALWARQMGEPLALMERPTLRTRWTHIVGDTMVFDRWSPMDRYSIVGFFPYFRRGVTRGMIDDLLDPQDEINVRRSARLNIIGRSANSGWLVHKGVLTPQEQRNLELNGGKPGLKLEWDSRNNTLPEPKQISPQQSPVAISELEKEAENDLLEISGINRSALGQVDQATVSGRAILARQQQSVIGLEGFISNYHRSVKMTGEAMLDLLQTFYTEPRIIRVLGEDEMNPMEIAINQRAADGVVNDITVGKYRVSIGETSLLESFLEGQFNELVTLAQQGMPIPDDFLIDASSIGRKEELRMAVRAQRAAAGQAPAVQGAPPGGGASQPPPGGGAPPGAPKPGMSHPQGVSRPPMPAGGPMGPHQP